MIRSSIRGAIFITLAIAFQMLAQPHAASAQSNSLANRAGGGGGATAFDACCATCTEVNKKTGEVLCDNCTSSSHRHCGAGQDVHATCSVNGDITVCKPAKSASKSLTTKQPTQKGVVPTIHEGCCETCGNKSGSSCSDCSDLSHNDCKGAGGISANCYLLNQVYTCTKDKRLKPGFTSTPPKKKPGLTSTPPAKN